MTKYEENNLAKEGLYLNANITNKRCDLLKYIEEHENSFWLYIDVVRKMIDDLYNDVIELVDVIRYMQMNNVSCNNYEDLYKNAKANLDFISMTKEMLNIK